MIKGTLLWIMLSLSGIVFAQIEPVSSPSTTTSNQSVPGSLFTNRTGTVYSTDQLGAQLQKLRNNIEQTLPMLIAYTESVSNSQSSGSRSLGGTVTEILSGVLNRRNSGTNTGSGNLLSGTNIVGVLQGLLTTNTTSTSSSVNAAALKDLADLQTELQAANSKLQGLNVPGTNSVIPLTPTGR
jgi:hypothetical protein